MAQPVFVGLIRKAKGTIFACAIVRMRYFQVIALILFVSLNTLASQSRQCHTVAASKVLRSFDLLALPQGKEEFISLLLRPFEQDGFEGLILERPDSSPSFFTNLSKTDQPAVSVSKLHLLDGSTAGFYVISRIGEDWGTRFTPQPYATHGNPIWPIKVFGKELAAFLGIRMLSPTQIVVPNEVFLNERIEALNHLLTLRSLAPIEIRVIKPKKDSEEYSRSEQYLRDFINGRIYVNQVVHDYSLHVAAEILSPPEIWQGFNHRAKILINFLDYWRSHRDEIRTAFLKIYPDLVEMISFMEIVAMHSLANFLTFERDYLSANLLIQGTYHANTSGQDPLPLFKDIQIGIFTDIMGKIGPTGPTVRHAVASLANMSEGAWSSEPHIQLLPWLSPLDYLSSLSLHSLGEHQEVFRQKVMRVDIHRFFILAIQNFFRSLSQDEINRPLNVVSSSEMQGLQSKVIQRLNDLRSVVILQ